MSTASGTDAPAGDLDDAAMFSFDPSALSQAEFVARFGAVYEHAPWIAERAHLAGLSADDRSVAGLASRLQTSVDAASEDEKLALLRAHPELAGKLAQAGALTAASTREQAGAGLDQCSAEEFAEFTALNARYHERHKHPFIIAVAGLDRAQILAEFRRRVDLSAKEERATALGEVHKIAHHRLVRLAQDAERAPTLPSDTSYSMGAQAAPRRVLTSPGMDALLARGSRTPLVVELVRGAVVESRHAVDAVIMDGDGATVSAHGDAEHRVFPRSSVKALQAVLLVESGAADAHGFEDRHLALACASHSGAPAHQSTALEMLTAAGCAPDHLTCGVAEPSGRADRVARLRQGLEPDSLCHPCSGKHSGYLAAARSLDYLTEGYAAPDHPLQRDITSALSHVLGVPLEPEQRGVDGCGVPTFAVPLSALARGFARLANAEAQRERWGAIRATALARLRRACLAAPEMVAGEGRSCTELMRAGGGDLFAKFGAEGVYVAAFPTLNLGFALKARDGGKRAAEVAAAGLSHAILAEAARDGRARRVTEAGLAQLTALAGPPVPTSRGAPAATLRFGVGL